MHVAITATACAALLLLGCSKPMTPEEKIAMLDSQRREILANLHRQQAECQAQAIEFSGTPSGEKIIEGCRDTFRFMVDTSRTTLENFDARIAEIREQQMKDNPFNQFDEK